MQSLLVRDLGQLEYLTALSYQQGLLKQKQEGRLSDVLLLVEHPHVFTLGVGGKEKNLLVPGNIPFHRASRGGDITYHGPGQLVIYPLVDLKSKVSRGIHLYLEKLELVLIHTLKEFGISAERRPRWTGVWIGTKKIAAIGIAVRKGITFHGAALNVNPDLSYFDRIIPCGLPWAQATSIERELGKEVDLVRVKKVFIECFTRRFQYTEIEKLCHEDTPTGSRSKPPVVPTTSASRGF